MKTISIVTPCYNEEENVEALYKQVKEIFKELPTYQYEHIFIDNASKDRTVDILEKIVATDKNVKVIVNNRNFGPIRSPYYGLLQAKGDAVILMVADLQDPPSMIKDFVPHWENGFQVVMAVKSQSDESRLMFAIRKLYYDLISRLSEIELTKNYTGFGLYDQQVIEQLRGIDDPYPYFRGLISYLGFKTVKVYYDQPTRKRGISKYNFYALYDTAMLGITNHSRVPLRLATMLGFTMAAFSFVAALINIVVKLFFWHAFPLGLASIIIGLFLFSSVQLFFIGIVGEYVGSIHTQTLKRPLIIERRRIGF